MPPKSKTKTDKKKVAKKGVDGTNKKPSVKGKTPTSKDLKKIAENDKNLKPTAAVSPPGTQDDMDEMRKRSSDEWLNADADDYETSPKKVRLAPEDPLKKAIEELDMEPASSESDTDAYYNRTDRDSFIADAEQLLGAQLLPEPEEDVDESTEDDAPEYLKQDELEEEPDFFGNFGDVPDVDEVSLDLSVDKVKEQPPPREKVEATGGEDVGKFVNPLTGEIMKSKETFKPDIPTEIKVIPEKAIADKVTAEKKTAEKVTDEKVVTTKKPTDDKVVTPKVQQADEDMDVEPSDLESVDISILSDQETEVEVLGPKVVDEEDAFTQFLEFEAHGPIETLEEIDVEALARAENARLLLAQTYEFVQYLINRAVEKSEYLDPQIILRQNLDKRKIMQELHEKLQLLEVERKCKQFLNRKCVEYFRRKRTFRPILDDNPKTLHIEYHKYQAAVSNLDHWLIKEEEAKLISHNNLKVTRENLAVEQKQTHEKIAQLEETIKKTLKRENFDKLQLAVNESLTKMEEVRKEISDIRFQLIQKQHDMATLVEVCKKISAEES